MPEKAIMARLKELGVVVVDDHVVYGSGRHGSAYVNPTALYRFPQTLDRLCRELVFGFNETFYEVVAGPHQGGLNLTQWMAFHTPPYVGDVPAVICVERGSGEFGFDRESDKLLPGRKVLVVQDFITTGGTIKRVVDAVREAGGEVVGVGAICNLGRVTAEDLGVPELSCLANLILETFPAGECPLCDSKLIPINGNVVRDPLLLVRQIPRLKLD